ncbi:hypothetical protein [Bacillus cereus]|uniref:hypothetical protein n=1 Tax=Bacillus TaxID=1386 RepID=UPI001596935E|nr:hypothetical protein [Bacillus cereus]MCH4568616.1 hypothetical protein [Bacillus sp. ES1-5]
MVGKLLGKERKNNFKIEWGYIMNLVNNNIEVLSEKEFMEINGGGRDLSTDVGKAVGWGLRIWDEMSRSSWETCKKRGITSRKDC